MGKRARVSAGRWLGVLFAAGALAQLAGPVSARAGGRDLDSDDAAINAYLKRFAESAIDVMGEAPRRWDAEGNEVAPGRTLRFSREAIESGAAIEARDRVRVERMSSREGAAGERSEIAGEDRPEELVDVPTLSWTLEALEAQGLRKATLPQQPWSDDYWGTYKGVLGARYADPGFPASDPDADAGYQWKNNFLYIQANPASQVLAANDPSAIDGLSPSEKYELLIGDSAASLTRRFWSRGKYYYDQTGKVETWMGICHGWAPASIMMPRATAPRTLVSGDGKRSIRFYPSDLKALATQAWASNDFSSRFIGGRCNDKNAATDANGRLTSQKCFDTNPGTWHMAVTHQLGVARRSFVFDATYDYEVWNQPAYAYAYRYFNPRTGNAVSRLSDAKVPLAQWSGDKFRQYRSKKAVSVVGIVMDLTYMGESDPSHRETDAPARDVKYTVRYYYDVELDAAGNIVGGEWWNNRHPDFIWVPTPTARARSVAERDASGAWDIAQPLPSSWRSAARKAARSGQVLGKLVETLLAPSP